MKQLFFVLFLSTIFMSFASAQKNCVISGPSSIDVGDTGVFSIPNLGQCVNCYDWDITSGGNNASIVGTDRQQSVVISADAPGSFSITVNYINEWGCHECVFTGTCSPAVDPCPEIIGVEDFTTLSDLDFEVILMANLIGDENWDVTGSTWAFNGPTTVPPNAPTPGNESGGPSLTNDNIYRDIWDCEPIRGVNNEVDGIYSLRVEVFFTHQVTGEQCSDVHTEQYNIPICGTDNGGFNGGGRMRVGPNPVRQELNIQFDEIELGTEVELGLYDYTGRLMKNKIVTSDTVIDTGDLNDGIYILKAQTADGFVETQKIYISK